MHLYMYINTIIYDLHNLHNQFVFQITDGFENFLTDSEWTILKASKKFRSERKFLFCQVLMRCIYEVITSGFSEKIWNFQSSIRLNRNRWSWQWRSTVILGLFVCGCSSNWQPTCVWRFDLFRFMKFEGESWRFSGWIAHRNIFSPCEIADTLLIPIHVKHILCRAPLSQYDRPRALDTKSRFPKRPRVCIPLKSYGIFTHQES